MTTAVLVTTEAADGALEPPQRRPRVRARCCAPDLHKTFTVCARPAVAARAALPRMRYQWTERIGGEVSLLLSTRCGTVTVESWCPDAAFALSHLGHA